MGKVGILTFHCADNYGAMLQAYGLKQYLLKRGIEAEIIRYEPPYMTGRHWWIPYIPRWGLKSILYSGWKGWIRNVKLGKSFFRRRSSMKKFRSSYLVNKRHRKILFGFQLKWLSYQYYIVGSDQIWNPNITLGLRKAYFGGFKSRNKKKVIAYAASLGGAFLLPEFDREFSILLHFVDAISVRENKAISYIKRFYEGEVIAVLDPVFLLEKEEWQGIEKLPNRKGYIFVYMTEKNDNLISYIKKLSERKGIPIIMIESGADIVGKNVFSDYEAGPSEFLGYIHSADYVVTNSFHGVAFSIIYQKKFMVFQHSQVGERINNILSLHGLEERIYKENENVNIDCDIEWNTVRKYTNENVNRSEKFLINHIE